MVTQVNKIYFNDLKNVSETNMVGSESTIYKCLFNNKFYLYKQPHEINQDLADKLNTLICIKNEYLVTPRIIIYDNNFKKPIGYLLNYLDDYKSLYYLELSKEEKIKILKMTKLAIIKMHKLGIIHCDLHTANIMYNRHDVKIIDFDSAKFLNYNPGYFNQYSREYLEQNIISKAIDIYNFNIDTFALLNNIAWDNVFKFDYITSLTNEQMKIWQKTKEKKELTYDDFLIDRY